MRVNIFVLEKYSYTVNCLSHSMEKCYNLLMKKHNIYSAIKILLPRQLSVVPQEIYSLMKLCHILEIMSVFDICFLFYF